jgi:very-short-patch-repair endonuclease
MSRDAIRHRLRQGRLRPIHRGVFAFGHGALTREGRWLAAVLAAGPSSVLSHRAAGSLQGIRYSDRLEVTSPRYSALRSVTVHTSPVPLDEITVMSGIPVTGISRTLLDLAAVVPAHQIERAANEALHRGANDPLSLADLVVRYPRRQGVRTVKELLRRLEVSPTFTRSELEARFIAFLRAVGLPEPRTNHWLPIGAEWIECDCVWTERRLIVELDGHAAHATPAAFERDRARDRALAAGGWHTIRVTWRQLHEEPEALAADLRRLLAP